jgi:hypothetical protein
MNTSILHTLPHFFPATLSRFTASLLALNLNAPTQYTVKIDTPLYANIHALHRIYADFVKQIENSTHRVHLAQQRLERFGVWREYAEHKAISGIDEALTSLGGMIRSRNAAEQALMKRGELPESIIARSAWFWFEQKYGHRALGEGDIASPRFADDRALTFQCALERPMVRSYDDEFGNASPLSLKARIFASLWENYQEAAQEHETIRSSAMLRVYELRKELMVSHGNLLWEVSIDEAFKL